MEIEERNEIEEILLEATCISRWTDSGHGIYAVLTIEESEQVVKNIFDYLDKAGYEIKKKS